MTAQPRMKVLTKVFLVSALAAAFLVPAAHAQVLDPTTILHFQEALPLPPPMPKVALPGFNGDYYEIAERQKTQQILPSTQHFPKTTVWAFGPAASSADSDDFSYPAHPIAATVNKPVRVKWINDLKDSHGNFIPHPLPIQQDVHWANPPGLCEGRKTPPDCAGSPKGQYTGPVPTVVHLHGAHTTSYSDGIPEAWYVPAGAAHTVRYTRGSDWSEIPGGPNKDGAAVFEYPNDQPAALLFFHDHTLGITAQNVYMGLVGGYLLHGGANDLASGLPSGPYEIPLVIQDKSFDPTGKNFVFTSEGNTIVVNGKTWPFVNVEPRQYRLRIVSGTDERFLLLSFNDGSDNGLKFTQIGGDAGFLPQPIQLHTLTLTSGERADVIVDFSGLPGQNVVLQTDGVDVVQFRVSASRVTAPTPIPALPYEGPVVCPATDPCATNPPRAVALFDHTLGTVTISNNGKATGNSMLWDAPTTENPKLGTTEVWDIYNFSGDPHPIHLHEVRYEVLERINIRTGVHKPPSPGETGRMDTAIANGHEILRVRAHFDIGGLYAWHCHIIEHEDEEMMRPMCVVDSKNPCNTK